MLTATVVASVTIDLRTQADLFTQGHSGMEQVQRRWFSLIDRTARP